MKAVIYARYSSDSQREESIEGQLRECLEFANKIGVDVVANYIDREYTVCLEEHMHQQNPSDLCFINWK